MTLSLSTVRAPKAPRPASAPVARYFTVWKQRRELAALDICRLSDMGISPADAAQESARPFWDID